MDNLQKENTEATEAEDATSTSADQEALETLPVESRSADSTGGTENSEDGEMAQTEEGTIGETEEGADSNAETDPLDKINERFDALEQKLQKKDEPAVKDLTEEEWAQAEANWGIPKTAIKKFAEKQVYLFNRVMDAVESRLGKYEKVQALQDLSRTPGFSDAMKYQKGIEEFLADYDPKHHSNPELLKKAVIYNRGLNMDKTIQRFRKEGDKNVRVAGVARPSSPNTNSSGIRKSTVAMNETQKSALSAFGMSSEEAAKYKAMSKKAFF